MEVLLLIISLFVIIIGIGGCVLPIIPGPPIAFFGMLLLHFSAQDNAFTYTTLFIYGILAVALTILDFYVPVWGTKKFGGTKWGTRGSTIGLILGAIVLPFLGVALPIFGLSGIILGPFLGAFVGEKMGGMPTNLAMKAGFGSFIGFLTGTFIKLIYCFVILFQYFSKLGLIPFLD